jgi:ABC-type lipoprotein export system ATPase subunit
MGPSGSGQSTFLHAETGEPIALAGPTKADVADFCAAVAP